MRKFKVQRVFYVGILTLRSCRQFGNCLVLAAVRKSWMRDLISHSRVVTLIERTIGFLRRLVPISPTLRVDAIILENTLKCLGNGQEDAA